MLPCFVYTWLNKCIGFMTIKKFYYITLYYSFEHCLATFLGKRLQRAIEFTQMKDFWPSEIQPTIVVSGGVACNTRIRSALEKVRKIDIFREIAERFINIWREMFQNRTQSSLFKVCESYDCQLVVPPLRYCTDNGVMIAWNGVEKWLKNQDILPYHQVFDVDVHPRVPFGTDISKEVSEARIKVKKVKF